MSRVLATKLRKLLTQTPHPLLPQLLAVLTGKTSLSSSGYPYISERSFQIFIREIPHLFQDGERLLSWLDKVEGRLSGKKATDGLAAKELESVSRALQVLRTVVQTAGVCAPPDLWVARQILSTYKKLDILKDLMPGRGIRTERLIQEGMFDNLQLQWDLGFLHCRGIIEKKVDGTWICARTPPASALLQNVTVLDEGWRVDMVAQLAQTGGRGLEKFLEIPAVRGQTASQRAGWAPTLREVEIGYRLVPVLLALSIVGATREARVGVVLAALGGIFGPCLPILEAAGLVRKDGRVTALGGRVFERGPGPFGIIYAYHAYFANHERLLRIGERGSVWVDRGSNVAASQAANRKTFEQANASIDAFCRDTGFRFDVFIEHALGQGEATRQRFERGQSGIRYFGADLEDAAIDRAVEEQKKGRLPRDMIFVRSADIGNPKRVTDAVHGAGCRTQDAVMVVGNGFHEIRGQDDRRIAEVFQGYCKAGIILVFTEESELSHEDLLKTAWNTYHAGFRYTHAISGQGLRAADALDDFGRMSWPLCASAGGYVVLKKYSQRGRTVFPHPRHGKFNSPISATYFCVPRELAVRLGVLD